MRCLGVSAGVGKLIDLFTVGKNPAKGAGHTKSRAVQKSDPVDKPRDTSETTSHESEGDYTPPSTTSNDNHDDLGTSQPLNAFRNPFEFVDDEVASILATPGLNEHRFICLSQYSLLRALLQNAKILALDFALLADDDSLSPWTQDHPYPTLTPHDLNPTALQLSTPHHPYLDIIPSPAFRDNILIMVADNPLEEQFCVELHSGSFTIWGSQPWDTQGMCLFFSF